MALQTARAEGEGPPELEISVDWNRGSVDVPMAFTPLIGKELTRKI